MDKRREYYQTHKEEILKNQRENHKKRTITKRKEELNKLIESANPEMKTILNRLVENLNEINKNDIKFVKRIVDGQV